MTIIDKTSIIVDKCKAKEKYVRNFNERFISNLNNLKNYSVDITHGNSIEYKELQIIDLIVWSVFQSVEHDNDEFINLLKDKIIKKSF